MKALTHPILFSLSTMDFVIEHDALDVSMNSALTYGIGDSPSTCGENHTKPNIQFSPRFY